MTVAQFQEVHRINSTTPDTIERMAWIICAVYGKTHDQVNNWHPRKFIRYSLKIQRELSAKPSSTNWVNLETDATKITLGQFVELQHWLRSEVPQVLDLIAASILVHRTNHMDDAAWLRKMPFMSIFPKVEQFIESWNALILSYKGLFEIDEKQPDEEIEQQIEDRQHPFIETYGWIFSAKTVADYEGIPLDKAYELPIIQALNDLAYLKSKAAFDKEQLKK